MWLTVFTYRPHRNMLLARCQRLQNKGTMSGRLGRPLLESWTFMLHSFSHRWSIFSFLYRLFYSKLLQKNKQKKKVRRISVPPPRSLNLRPSRSSKPQLGWKQTEIVSNNSPRQQHLLNMPVALPQPKSNKTLMRPHLPQRVHQNLGKQTRHLPPLPQHNMI